MNEAVGVRQQYCDECGREVDKMHRVHEGVRYCATCYARCFKRRICPKCGNFARLPKKDPLAICRKCEKEKPCARCGKTDYKLGKITHYGPVCNACAPHFRDPESCEACGKPSPRLTRVKRQGHALRVCPKCARADYGTCSACRRHRLLADGPDGRKLCKSCLEKGEVPCQSCGGLMPAGYGKRCPRCYWRGLLEKRVRMDCAAFSARAMASHFKAFGQWLMGKAGEHKAAITIHRYLPFFIEIEREWGAVPDYKALLEYFGAQRLRRVLLPMRWMLESGLIVPDDKVKEEDTERRRIDAIMASIPHGTLADQALSAYRDELMKRLAAGDTKIRSVRLALRPAASLLKACDASGHALPSQAALDKYLISTPGQKAAITGFTIYLNRRYSLGLVPRVDEKRAKAARRRKLEAEMMTLIREARATGFDGIQQRWVAVALEYFHGLSRVAAVFVRADQVTMGEGGLSILIDNKSYWIPQPINNEISRQHMDNMLILNTSITRST